MVAGAPVNGTGLTRGREDKEWTGCRQPEPIKLGWEAHPSHPLGRGGKRDFKG